uniref:5-aminolevulinate synthase n=1 Tax=Crassostrea virginica TaxID=6565 RepID=A0A8B8B8F0_CRAVI|nr:5-aminolevulinate synthase, erythroid-specific, mitochondrial-like isoform X1 [Crassostrea virginica]
MMLRKMSTALRCPFLSRIPVNQVKKTANHLMSYAERCPVMVHAMSYMNGPDMMTVTDEPMEKQCPFFVKDGLTIKDVKSNVSSMKDTIPQKDVTVTASMPVTKATAVDATVTAPKYPSGISVEKTLEWVKQWGTGGEKELKVKAEEEVKEKETEASRAQPKLFNYENFFENQIEKKKSDHTYRVFKKVMRRGNEFPYAVDYSSGKKHDITVWCSNDYLGMSWHPKVINAVSDALKTHGAGAGGTRNISGNSPLHEGLEAELASLHQKEAALVFTSCYVANDTSLYTLGKSIPGVHMFSDEGNHASMIQGIRNCGVPKHIFRHNDPLHLEEMLRSVDSTTPKIVVFETVHSMTGDISPLREMCEVAHKYGALTFVDEVHAVGLYGEQGAGVGERDGCMDQIDIISGTLGKAFGNVGGYIASTARTVDMIRSYGSGFIFTTSLPPTTLAGSIASIRVLRSEEGRQLRQRHQSNVRYLRDNLIEAGVPTLHSPSHIIPIHVGDAALCTHLSSELMNKYDIYVQAINYPTVARGMERLRVAPTPHHTKAMMDYFVSSVVKIWKDNGLELSRERSVCPEECEVCHKPLAVEMLQAEEKVCGRSNCTYASLQDNFTTAKGQMVMAN